MVAGQERGASCGGRTVAGTCETREELRFHDMSAEVYVDMAPKGADVGSLV